MGTAVAMLAGAWPRVATMLLRPFLSKSLELCNRQALAFPGQSAARIILSRQELAVTLQVRTLDAFAPAAARNIVSPRSYRLSVAIRLPTASDNPVLPQARDRGGVARHEESHLSISAARRSAACSRGCGRSSLAP